MKWKRGWRGLLVALLVGGCARRPGIPLAPPPVVPPAQVGKGPEWCQVFFSRLHPGDVDQAQEDPASIDRHLAYFLNQARRSIDAALHELDNDRITSALLSAHKRGVRVRVLTETDYRDEANIADLQRADIPVKDDQGRPGLMHNKFLIIDGQAVWTGSFNPTDNCAYKNNNNALLIHSPQVASYFTAEFNKLFERGDFGRGASWNRPPPVVRMKDGTEVLALFSPENDVAGAIIREISGARHSIRFLAFSFTHNGIAQALLRKREEGVLLQGIFETRGSDTSVSEFARFRKAGLDVHADGNPYNMHHKVILIDDDTVITGSFNFSRNAVENNEENLVILRGNRAIAAAFREEFERVYQTATGRHPTVRIATNPRRRSQSSPRSPAPPRPPLRKGREERGEPSPARQSGERVNVNTASAEELTTLPGVGKELAQRIITDRPYREVEDLLRVNGIGRGKLRQLRGRVTVR